MSMVKARHLKNTTDNTIAFKDWHRTLSYKCTAQDIDMLEYHITSEGIKFVGVFELTNIYSKGGKKVLNDILTRITVRDRHGDVLKEVGKRLSCDAYILVFNDLMEPFWLYDLMKPEFGWVTVSRAAMQRWIEKLREREILL